MLRRLAPLAILLAPAIALAAVVQQGRLAGVTWNTPDGGAPWPTVTVGFDPVGLWRHELDALTFPPYVDGGPGIAMARCELQAQASTTPLWPDGGIDPQVAADLLPVQAQDVLVLLDNDHVQVQAAPLRPDLRVLCQLVGPQATAARFQCACAPLSGTACVGLSANGQSWGPVSGGQFRDRGQWATDGGCLRVPCAVPYLFGDAGLEVWPPACLP